MAQHGFGDFKVSNHTVPQGADSNDVAGGAAEHALGIVPDGEHLVGAGIDGDHRRFPQDNTVVFDVDQGVGGSEIDSNVI